MHPILFKIGNFPVHTFGVIMVVAFFLGVKLAMARADQYGITKSQMSDLATWTLLAGILGARGLFILQDLPYFLAHKDELFSLKFQGLTSFGGLIGGTIAAALWTRKTKVPMVAVLDLLAPAFILGHTIGRFGCLLNGCCYGGVCPTGTWYGVHVEGDDRLHLPTQVLDAAMNFAVLGGLLWAERRGLPALRLTGLALAGHGLARFLYEFTRAGSVAAVDSGAASSTLIPGLPITEAQVMALFIVTAGVVLIGLSGRRGAARAAA